MLRNYIKIAFRSLTRNSVYSFINISGLAVGLGCFILILLWVNDELNWDGSHLNKAHVYQIMLNAERDNGIQTQAAAPLPLLDELRSDADILRVTPTDWGSVGLFAVGEKKLYKKYYYADPDFLKIFTFPLLHGAADQLKDPSSFVISASMAKALFGTDDAVGKVVRADNNTDLTVTGVMADAPVNSTFDPDCLIPFALYSSTQDWVKQSYTNWQNNAFNIFIQLADQADPAAVEARIKNIIRKKANVNNEPTLFAMDRWRLYATFENGKSASGSIVYVRIFSIIAVFILVIACINFMNLATARSERRAREVGIRKTIGSGRKELIVQFLGETFIITLIASVVALALSQAVLPLYNAMVDKQLSIDFSSPYAWGGAVAIVVATSLLAGSYPAFYLSSFQPAAALKGKMQAGKSGSVPRKTMVVVQFFFSIGLIISTIVVYQQLQHLKDRPSGYEKENLILVENSGDIMKNYNAIKQALLSKDLATAMTTSSSPVTTIYAYMDASWSGKRVDQKSSIAMAAIGLEYTKTLGIRVTEGRDFSEAFNDTLSMILNKTAVAYMGFEKPLEESVTYNRQKYRVVGVVDDVVMTSPRRAVDPMMFILNPEWTNDISIRLNPGSNRAEQLAKTGDVFRQYNPAYPFNYRFADVEFAKKFSGFQLIGRLANLFASLAIIISCLGLFGLAAFMAEQRTKEIGIRKVMGARISSITMLLSGDFTKLIVIAFLFAAPLALWMLTQWLAEFNYRITISWWVPVLAGFFTLLLSLSTVIYQAIKAAMADPVKSLRNE